ncbi:MAG: ATP-binding cassette domain-containing protein, partial [Acidimicrobiales bacterium]
MELQGIHAGYGKIEVLHEVNLAVPATKVVVLLGPNGAGKTTSLKVASGRVRSTSGRVLIDGQDLTSRTP